MSQEGGPRGAEETEGERETETGKEGTERTEEGEQKAKYLFPNVASG